MASRPMFDPEGPTLRELLAQGFSSLERGYDLLAPKFEHTPFRTPDALVQKTAEALGPERSVGSALDLCCGTGAGMRALRPLCRELVAGVDLSAGMLREASRQLEGARGSAAISLVRGDVLSLPFRAAFDVATCFGALGHIARKDERRFVRSVASALRPGGRFAFLTTDRLPPWDPARWVAHAFNAGWRVRNALFRPRFVMYYLTFQVPEATALLESEGFGVEVRRGLFGDRYRRIVLVIATRRSDGR